MDAIGLHASYGNQTRHFYWRGGEFQRVHPQHCTPSQKSLNEMFYQGSLVFHAPLPRWLIPIMNSKTSWRFIIRCNIKLGQLMTFLVQHRSTHRNWNLCLLDFSNPCEWGAQEDRTKDTCQIFRGNVFVWLKLDIWTLFIPSISSMFTPGFPILHSPPQENPTKS